MGKNVLFGSLVNHRPGKCLRWLSNQSEYRLWGVKLQANCPTY
jgi:hypothetical protein